MPHKRAKQSVRNSNRKKTGFDLAPTKETGMSRRMSDVLFAEQIRTELKQKKRARDGDDEDEREGPKSSKHKKLVEDEETAARIKPGESMGAFSRRVEEEYKGKMSDAYKKASKNGRKKRKEVDVEEKEKETPERAGKKEFERRSERKRVNDVAEAPPTLTRLPRTKSGLSAKELPVSGIQQRLMEEERERVVEHYRALKRQRLKVI